MKIPIGTREEEREIHHYVEKYKVSEPVYLEIHFFPIALVAAFFLAVVWQTVEPKSLPTPTTVNIHIEK